MSSISTSISPAHKPPEPSNELTNDLVAFEKILNFYSEFKNKLLDSIDYARSYSELLEAQGATIDYQSWTQIGDVLWQIIPEIEKELEKAYNIKNCLNNLEEQKEEEFYTSFNQILMQLALAIKVRRALENFRKESETTPSKKQYQGQDQNQDQDQDQYQYQYQNQCPPPINISERIKTLIDNEINQSKNSHPILVINIEIETIQENKNDEKDEKNPTTDQTL
jgi:hypothetical protein